MAANDRLPRYLIAPIRHIDFLVLFSMHPHLLFFFFLLSRWHSILLKSFSSRTLHSHLLFNAADQAGWRDGVLATDVDRGVPCVDEKWGEDSRSETFIG